MPFYVHIKNFSFTKEIFLNYSVKKNEHIGLDFEVDKLTNSIENVATGEVFNIVIEKLNNKDKKQI